LSAALACRGARITANVRPIKRLVAMSGLFGVNTPRMLYDRLTRNLAAFANKPSEDGVFEVIFPLYHLREWVCPGGYESYKDIPEQQRTREQCLHSRLHAMSEYQIIRDLCNNAKHFEGRGNGRDMRVLEGARAGLARAGDRLNVTHFVIDGHEIRECFDTVTAEYRAYFSDES
jgi:hypothetical protein